jgi:hypothetical protein
MSWAERVLRKMLWALIVAAVLLAGFDMAKAHADVDTDQVFLATLQDAGINSTRGPVGLIGAAHVVCDMRIRGSTEMQAIQYIYHESQLGAFLAGYFVGASEAAYCPDYEDTPQAHATV